ncbi:hypothetical protein [Pseudomonas sp. LS-2]|uniref:hypothetical protein n=1 Tax=Pseudomonas sp. LS-2 TaxID=2315859 RepID=UPI000E74217B|nr:hypothetical protein [Pseudomonas sp. LS-2]RJX82258.1 hypothetical protein D3M70_06695 [Pseudomonas sp. LS-2]
MKSSRMITAVGENSRVYEGQMRSKQRELSNAHEAELRLQYELTASFQQLAGVQLQDGGKLPLEVQEHLSNRAKAELDLRRQLADTEGKISQHIDSEVDLQQQLDSMLSTVSSTLNADESYAGWAAKLAVASQAVQAAKSAYLEIKTECSEKLKAFDASMLYRYLTGAGYGSAAYQRMRLLWSIDRWIARLCSFSRNRDAELTLLAMQQENEGSFKELECTRQLIHTELGKLYDAALAKAGVPVLKDRLAQVRIALEASKSFANELHLELQDFASKKDPHFARATSLLTDQLSAMSLERLEQMASLTATKTDDDLVRLVASQRDEFEAVKRHIRTLSDECRTAERAYERAKSLERDLRSSSYTGSGYTYASGLNLDSLLTGYMAGSLSQSQVTSQVSRYREETPRPSSSSETGSGFGSLGGDSGGFFTTSGSDNGGSFQTTDSL